MGFDQAPPGMCRETDGDERMEVNLNLIAFYEGTAPDNRDRWLSEIQAWDFGQLEAVHDYIQWLFPLRKRSPVNPEAPVIERDVSDAFRSRTELQAALIRSLKTMLRFYGFELDGTDEQPIVIRSDQFAVRAANWMTPSNHNHLRITRILGCLRALGLDRHTGRLELTGGVQQCEVR